MRVPYYFKVSIMINFIPISITLVVGFKLTVCVNMATIYALTSEMNLHCNSGTTRVSI